MKLFFFRKYVSKLPLNKLLQYFIRVSPISGVLIRRGKDNKRGKDDKKQEVKQILY
jgi:hypothetical protein